jgi:hypothetical protein
MRWFSLTALFAIFFLMPFMATAQNQSPPPAADQQLLKAEELDALVAPIALYPDTLLAQVLMASTYPLEVVQADRWATENKKLKEDELKAAADKQAWDDSVKALVATPSVLAMMSGKLDWTQKLGDAVLAQQPDVMDAVQRLRSKAQANGKLSSTKEQTVKVEKQQAKQVIVIEPTNPETVYVPYYNPSVVYGGWPYPAYPPYYFGYPGYVPGALLATGIAFGAGYALGRWGAGGNYWGGSVNWNNNNININRPRVNPLGGNNWQHNPAHRQGVRYNNPKVQQRFGNNSLRNGSQGRMDFRGRGGQQVLRPGGGAGAATRPAGGGNRPATRPAGGRTGAASRPAGGAGRGNALGNMQSGRAASMQSQRGRASFASAGRGGGGAMRGGGGGGGMRGGGGGGGGRGGGGGGRRSDIRLKHDITRLGQLDDGLGFYRFAYNGSDKAYVGVMAQEVQMIEPEAVVVGRDGYFRVLYSKLGFKMQTYDQWIASGARIPSTTHIRH